MKTQTPQPEPVNKEAGSAPVVRVQPAKITAETMRKIRMLAAYHGLSIPEVIDRFGGPGFDAAMDAVSSELRKVRK